MKIYAVHNDLSGVREVVNNTQAACIMHSATPHLTFIYTKNDISLLEKLGGQVSLDQLFTSKKTLVWGEYYAHEINETLHNFRPDEL